MSEEANGTVTGSQAVKQVYRVVPGGRAPKEFCVATGTPDEPDSALGGGFATREKAQAEADRLNALAEAFEEGDGGRRDAVLGRMMLIQR